MMPLKVLVGCEQSQVVTKAFRALGHEAYSCDILPCSGGHPEWHIQDDVLKHLNDGWDMGIFHPPCTYLSNSGVGWLFNYKGESLRRWEVWGLTGYTGPLWRRADIKRFRKMHDAAEFFSKLLLADIPRIVIENPIQHKYAFESIVMRMPFEKIEYSKYDQIIHPWMFGHMEQKPTCLWLKNVPPLKETDNVYEEMKKLPANQRQRIHYMPPSAHRAQDRAVTYEGIGAAMASQWSVLP